MPQVARVEGPSVAIDPVPLRYQSQHLDPGYADGIVKGVQDLGGAALQIAQNEQDKADTASVLEAQRKLGDLERSWFDPRNPEGVYAKKGRDALGLTDKIAPDFDRAQAEIAGNLRNPKARDAFARYAAGKRESVLDRVNGYAVREHDGYVQAEVQASISNSVESAATAALEGRYPDQAREVSEGLKTIRAQAAMLGEPPEMTRVKERSYLSTVHATAVNGMLANGNVMEAAAYFHDNAEDISAAQVGELQARMRPLLIDAANYAIVDGMDKGVTADSIGGNTSVDQIWPHVIQTESGGKQSAVSVKGAVGVAQVMPGTGPIAAKMAGLEWDAEKFKTDPTYNEALGKAYLASQLQTFGSMPLALAAYNAGPGKVQEWLNRYGDPRRGQISMADFVAAIPYGETKKYVAGITEAAGGSGPVVGAAAAGQGAPAGGLEAQLAVARRFSDPQQRADLEQKIRTRYTIREQDRQDQDREARKGILAAVEAMDPRQPLAKGLSPDQNAFADQNDMKSGLEGRLRERVQGVDPVTPPDVLASLQRIFYDASRGSVIARNEVAKMDVLDLPLSPKDREWAQQTQASMMKPQADAKAVAFASEAQILDGARAKLGIPSGQSGDKQWGPFLVQYLEAKRQAVKTSGELTAEGQQAIVDRLTVPFVRESFFGDTKVPAYRAKAGDIPAPLRDKLAQAARKLLKREPTEAELVSGYTVYRQNQAPR